MAWYNSSANAEKISLTLKGVIPLIVLGATYAGFDIGESELTGIIDSGVAVVVQGGILISAAMTFTGLIRKVFNKINKIKSKDDA